MRNIQIENATMQELLDSIQMIIKGTVVNQESKENFNDELLTRAETAKLLQVSLATLNNWAKSGVLIPSALGNRVFYRMSDILKSMKPIHINNTKN